MKKIFDVMVKYKSGNIKVYEAHKYTRLDVSSTINKYKNVDQYIILERGEVGEAKSGDILEEDF